MSHTLRDNANEWDTLSPILQQAIYFNVQSGMFALIHSLTLVDSVIMYWLDDPTAPVPPPPVDAMPQKSETDKEGDA